MRWAPTDLPIDDDRQPGSLYYPFDPSGDGCSHGYVWHCHIIDHEDNEMMRPDVVQLNPDAPAAAARPLGRPILGRRPERSFRAAREGGLLFCPGTRRLS